MLTSALIDCQAQGNSRLIGGDSNSKMQQDHIAGRTVLNLRIAFHHRRMIFLIALQKNEHFDRARNLRLLAI